jgi:signal transduction histidine kinase
MATILIVDDHAENRYLLEALLAGRGHAVGTAADGLEALELASARDFDLVIADILMPRMDGFELCRTWKRDPRLARIPFVYYTATYTEPSDERFALGLGAERFLIKPLEPEALLAEIEALLGASPGLREPMVDALFTLEHNRALFRKLESKVAENERLGRSKAGLEEELAQHRQVESLGRLAASAAHDLNNLLVPILHMADLMLEKYGDHPDLHRRLATILMAAERARDLVQGLNDYTRKGVQERAPTDLNELARQTADLLRPDGGPHLSWVLDLEPELAPIQADPTALGRVLLNLARNAMDATAPAGVLTLRTRTGGSDRVVLEVADTGRGIAPDHLARVLEPFFTTKPPGRGTGLGLAIVQNIVRAHGGTLELASEPGRGTTVRVELPSRASAASERATSTHAKPC